MKTLIVTIFTILLVGCMESPVEPQNSSKMLEPGRFTTSPDIRDIRTLSFSNNSWIFVHRDAQGLNRIVDTLQCCYYDSVQVSGFGGAIIPRLHIWSNENPLVDCIFYVRL